VEARDKQQKWRSGVSVLVAMVAVLGAWAISFIMSWITPARGLGCRSFMELGIMAVWVITFAYRSIFGWIAAWLARLEIFKDWEKRNLLGRFCEQCRSIAPWVAVLIDAGIAISSIICLFAAWKGKSHFLEI
jgi:hypothetical protein